jgi:multidrug efflux pump
LKPLEDRNINASDVIRRLQPSLAKIDGISLYMQPIQDLTVEDIVSRTQYQYTLEDPDANELASYASRFVRRLKELPELADVASDLQTHGVQARVNFDRQTAMRLGINTSALDETLYDAFGQRLVSILFTQLNQYHVVLEVQPQFRTRPNNLHDIYLKSTTGAPVPLSAFTSFSSSTAPILISHIGQFPATTISFNLAPHAALGEAVDAIRKAQKEMPLPAAMQSSFQGTAQAFVASLTNEPLLILAALVTVYIVLGVLYESYIHPVTILSTLPSAGVGALLALMVCRQELTVVAIIGIVLLIGIVKKNAIMMIDFALDAERKEGKSPYDSIFQASLLRFRPIMMTTMAALLGAVPLAFGRGVGSELRRPLGITIIGGLLLSQLLTLYTTPVIYLFFDNAARRFAGFRKRHGFGAAEEQRDPGLTPEVQP